MIESLSLGGCIARGGTGLGVSLLKILKKYDNRLGASTDFLTLNVYHPNHHTTEKNCTSNQILDNNKTDDLKILH